MKAPDANRRKIGVEEPTVFRRWRGLMGESGGGGGVMMLLWPDRHFCSDWLQLETVFTGGDHGEKHWASVAVSVHVLVFQPGAKPWVDDFGVALPEICRQAALNPQVPQVDFDGGEVLREVQSRIFRANV